MDISYVLYVFFTIVIIIIAYKKKLSKKIENDKNEYHRYIKVE